MATIIVAADRGDCIGNKNGIPFYSDMQFFKETTMGGVVIMGRKTWESLPLKYKPLTDRINVIVSTTYDDGRWMLKKDGQPFYVFRSLAQAIQFSQAEHPEKEHFIIGGWQLWQKAFQTPNLVTKVLLSKIGVETPECDTHFLSIGQLEQMFGKHKIIGIDNEAEEPVVRIRYGK